MTSTKSALAPVVSKPFELEPLAPSLHQPHQQNLFEIVSSCGSTRCFAAFQQNVGPGEGSNWGTRFDGLGRMSDTPRLPLDSRGWAFAVVPLGQDFVVVHGEGGQNRQLLGLERVRGSDGARTGFVTAGLPSEYFDVAAGSASSFVIAASRQGTKVYLYDSAMKPIGTPAALASSVVPSTIVPGDEQYLLAGGGFAARLDAKTGLWLDATPIELTKYVSPPPTALRGVYSNGIYYLAYSAANAYDFYGLRIRASDGALLDPPDEFNAAAGVKLWCAACRGLGQAGNETPSLALVDGEVNVSFLRGEEQTFHAFTVDASTGLRPGGETALPPAVATLPTEEATQADSVGASSVIRQGNRVFSLAPSTTAAGFELGDEQVIAPASKPRSHLTVSSNGRDYLAAFFCDQKIYATRIQESSGEILDSPALELGDVLDTEPPLIAGVARTASASDGDGYLVAWAKGWTSLGRARVGADGTVTPLADVPAPDSPVTVFPSSLDLAFNGEYYFLTWVNRSGMFGQRMQPDGALVDIVPVALRDGDWTAIGRAMVVADTTPSADRRTFLYLFGNQGLRSRRIRSATGAVLAQTVVAEGVADGDSFAATTDGTDALVAFQVGTNLSVARVDPVSGNAVSRASVLRVENEIGHVGAAFHDGLGLNLILTSRDSSSNSRAYIQRLTNGFERLDANVPGLGTPLVSFDNVFDFDVSTAPSRKSLVVYSDTAPERFGMAARAVWITNDGMEAPTPPATGGAGPGGGSGGESDAAGAPAAGGSTTAGNSGAGRTGNAGAGGAATGGVASDSGGNDAGSSGSNGGGRTSRGGSGSGATTGVAGNGSSASAGETPSADEDGGCGCRIARASSTGPYSVGLLAVVLAARRRRAGETRSPRAKA